MVWVVTHCTSVNVRHHIQGRRVRVSRSRQQLEVYGAWLSVSVFCIDECWLLQFPSGPVLLFVKDFFFIPLYLTFVIAGIFWTWMFPQSCVAYIFCDSFLKWTDYRSISFCILWFLLACIIFLLHSCSKMHSVPRF